MPKIVSDLRLRLYASPEYICNYIDITNGYIKILLYVSLRGSSFTFSNNEFPDVTYIEHMTVCETFDHNVNISGNFIGVYIA